MTPPKASSTEESNSRGRGGAALRALKPRTASGGPVLRSADTTPSPSSPTPSSSAALAGRRVNAKITRFEGEDDRPQETPLIDVHRDIIDLNSPSSSPPIPFNQLPASNPLQPAPNQELSSSLTATNSMIGDSLRTSPNIDLSASSAGALFHETVHSPNDPLSFQTARSEETLQPRREGRAEREFSPAISRMGSREPSPAPPNPPTPPARDQERTSPHRKIYLKRYGYLAIFREPIQPTLP
jgi:hypothetical protein